MNHTFACHRHRRHLTVPTSSYFACILLAIISCIPIRAELSRILIQSISNLWIGLFLFHFFFLWLASTPFASSVIFVGYLAEHSTVVIMKSFELFRPFHGLIFRTLKEEKLKWCSLQCASIKFLVSVGIRLMPRRNISSDMIKWALYIFSWKLEEHATSPWHVLWYILAWTPRLQSVNWQIEENRRHTYKQKWLESWLHYGAIVLFNYFCCCFRLCRKRTQLRILVGMLANTSSKRCAIQCTGGDDGGGTQRFCLVTK